MKSFIKLAAAQFFSVVEAGPWARVLSGAPMTGPRLTKLKMEMHHIPEPGFRAIVQVQDP
jgi:hypothetical protein